MWEFAPLSYIKRSPAEKGAPANGQPLQVSVEALTRALGTVRVVVKAKEEPLFLPAEVAAIADFMSEALSMAQPGEDLELLSTMTRGRGIFGSSLSVTARVFVLDGKLNLIVHDARLEFLYYPSLSDNRMPNLEFGSRAEAGPTVLKVTDGESPRPDWVVLPLTAPAPPAAMPSPRSASFEEHLRDLKRFRDLNLITEDEYAKQKQELLRQLTKDTDANRTSSNP
jgi:hypothetical protein